MRDILDVKYPTKTGGWMDFEIWPCFNISIQKSVGDKDNSVCFPIFCTQDHSHIADHRFLPPPSSLLLGDLLMSYCWISAIAIQLNLLPSFLNYMVLSLG